MRSTESERLPLLRKTAAAEDLPGLGDRCPTQHAQCLASLSFAWLTPLLRLGNARPLESEDLFQLDPHNRAATVTTKFQQQWTQQVASSRPSLAAALASAFGAKFAAAGLLKLLHDSLQFVGPLIIKRIISYLNDPVAPLSLGLTYVGIVLLAGVVQSFALRQYFFFCFETGLQLRSAMATAVFRKSLVLSAAARQKKTAGEITNLMTLDAQRLQDLTPYLHGIWYSFFQIAVACVLLWQQIGVATFAGVAVIVLLIPVMALISKAMGKLQERLMAIKDDRIKICHEVLAGIKVIKMKAWENSFASRVMGFRDDELARLRTYLMAEGVSTTLFSLVPSLVAVTSIVTYVLLGNTLDVGTALTSIALFNILGFPLFMLPQVLNNVVEAHVSVTRLRNFLLEDERVRVGPGRLTDVGVLVQNGDFHWDGEPADQDVATEKPKGPILHNITFQGKSGELHAIVGAVGCGKSTLLAGLLGDARCSAGEVALRGSVAYVGQQPFIQNATVRENICFGIPFDAARYNEAIRVSCLQADLKILPGGDATEIGEKGINLSGGQRTRVALARAVYQNADIYVLDDILSAVDSHVGSDIFSQCIKTALKDKLVLLVTHSLSVLNRCDNIVVLHGGRIIEAGAYNALMEKSEGVLAQMVAGYVEQDHNEEEHDEDVEDVLEEVEQEDAGGVQQHHRGDRRSRTSSTRSDSSALDDDGQLMTDEDRSTGDVVWAVYRAWIDAFGGMPMGLVVVLGYVVSQALALLSTLWISHWSQAVAGDADSQMYYVNVYVALNGAYAVALFLRVVLLYFGGLRASRILFEQLLKRVLRAPVAFFDTTPLGRIVNRLSKDVYTVDESIPSTWEALLGCLVRVAVTVGTICVVTPSFMVILAPVVAVYYMSQRYFIRTSRELQRLDSISRSPLFALLSETLDGMSTIRAYNVEDKFIGRNQHLLDTNQRAYFLNFSVNCWLGLRLEFVGTMIAAGAALAAVLAHWTNPSPNAAFAGLVGVSLTYAFDVTQELNWMVRMISQLQTQMVSVERIKTYAEMPTEAELETRLDRLLRREWPTSGQVSFHNVSLRYREGLPRVLRGLSFEIDAHEKIGIVGRTGAGKSSLIVALMRLTELDGGVIAIDGVDISTLGLHDLRSRVAIIPQDPVLFSGTVRSNLDPFDQFSDDQLWTSIRRAHLDKAVVALDERVDEKGTNFSVGERQLLSIARALLQRSKVILMDEATASIDAATDRKIQQSIREEFADCTCLTIAHRLNTILDSDRILVMDQGRVAEFGPPAELQRNPQSIFKSLVDHWRQRRDE